MVSMLLLVHLTRDTIASAGGHSACGSISVLDLLPSRIGLAGYPSGGDQVRMVALLGLLDPPDPNFAIITP
jgi:hypothetical protein